MEGSELAGRCCLRWPPAHVLHVLRALPADRRQSWQQHLLHDLIISLRNRLDQSQEPSPASAVPPSSARSEAILTFLEPHLLQESQLAGGRCWTSGQSGGWSSEPSHLYTRPTEDRPADQPPAVPLWHRFIVRAAQRKAESADPLSTDTTDRCELLKRDLLHSLTGLGDLLRRDSSSCSFYSVESDSLQERSEPAVGGPEPTSALSEEAARLEAQAMVAAGLGRHSSSESELGISGPAGHQDTVESTSGETTRPSAQEIERSVEAAAARRLDSPGQQEWRPQPVVAAGDGLTSTATSCGQLQRAAAAGLSELDRADDGIRSSRHIPIKSPSPESDDRNVRVQMAAPMADGDQRHEEHKVAHNVLRKPEVHASRMEFAPGDQRSIKMHIEDTWCNVDKLSLDEAEKRSAEKCSTVKWSRAWDHEIDRHYERLIDDRQTDSVTDGRHHVSSLPAVGDSTIGHAAEESADVQYRRVCRPQAAADSPSQVLLRTDPPSRPDSPTSSAHSDATFVVAVRDDTGEPPPPAAGIDRTYTENSQVSPGQPVHSGHDRPADGGAVTAAQHPDKLGSANTVERSGVGGAVSVHSGDVKGATWHSGGGHHCDGQEAEGLQQAPGPHATHRPPPVSHWHGLTQTHKSSRQTDLNDDSPTMILSSKHELNPSDGIRRHTGGESRIGIFCLPRYKAPVCSASREEREELKVEEVLSDGQDSSMLATVDDDDATFWAAERADGDRLMLSSRSDGAGRRTTASRIPVRSPPSREPASQFRLPVVARGRHLGQGPSRYSAIHGVQALRFPSPVPPLSNSPHNNPGTYGGRHQQDKTSRSPSKQSEFSSPDAHSESSVEDPNGMTSPNKKGNKLRLLTKRNDMRQGLERSWHGTTASHEASVRGYRDQDQRSRKFRQLEKLSLGGIERRLGQQHITRSEKPTHMLPGPGMERKSGSMQNLATRKPKQTPLPKSKTFGEELNRHSVRSSASSVFGEGLQGFASPSHALQEAYRKLASNDWQCEVSGLTDLVRLFRHHPEAAIGDLKAIIAAIVKQMKSLRSQVSRAAVQAGAEMFQHVGKAAEPNMDKIVATLLQKTSDTNKFIKADSNRALDLMLENVSVARAVVTVTSEGLGHRNSQVRATVSRLLSAVVGRLGATGSLCGQKEITERLVPAAAQLVREGDLQTRMHAKAIFRIWLQYRDLDKVLAKYLPGTEKTYIDKVVHNIRNEVPRTTAASASLTCI